LVFSSSKGVPEIAAGSILSQNGKHKALNGGLAAGWCGSAAVGMGCGNLGLHGMPPSGSEEIGVEFDP
jgi:hypothetical protein